MKRMARILTFTATALLCAGVANAGKYSDTIDVFRNAGESGTFFNRSYAYAVFPTVGEGGFVVDVGGGTTEVAAVAGWRVVRAESLRMAGNAMDDAIISAARSGLGMILSQRAARQLKAELGLTGGPEGWAETVGLDAARRTPRVEKVPGDLVAAALGPVVSAIGTTVQNVLSDIPAGLAEDVVRGQVRLSGGGALLPGLAGRLSEVAGMGVTVVDDPLRAVVRGAAAMLGSGGAPGGVER